MAEQHAKLSASGSAKWLGCAASLALEELLAVSDTPSAWSQEGTAAHDVLYNCLQFKQEPADWLDKVVCTDAGTEFENWVDVTQEMVDAVEVCVDYVRRLTHRQGYYETRVDYSHIAPNGFGTTDIALEVRDKVGVKKFINTLYIVDFKYGKGIKVDAFENSQLKLYALGALQSLGDFFEKEIERVVIVVVQPRLDHIDEFTVELKDLLAWGEEIKPKAQIANSLYNLALEAKNFSKKDPERIIPPEHFNPSKKACQWCQGRRTNKCKAYAQTGYEAAVEGFSDLTQSEKDNIAEIEVSTATIKDPSLLEFDELAAIYKKVQLFKDFTKELTEEIINRIKQGHSVPGLKLVDTVKARAWRYDDEKTIKAIRTAGLQQADYIKKRLISPTEAEKKLKEVKPNDHAKRYRKLESAAIHRPPGDPKLVEDNTPEIDDEDDLLG